MNAYTFALDILKLIIAGVVIAYALFFFFKNYFEQHLNSRMQSIKAKELATVLPLRLQAHERLLLFVDRINPENILIRLHQPDLTAKQIQALIISEIRAEYQHNITQQLYIDHSIWEMVRKLKDDTILMIDNASKGLGNDCDATTYSKTILSHMGNIEENPYLNASYIIKQHIQDIF